MDRIEQLLSGLAAPFAVKDGERIIGAVVFKSKNFWAFISRPGNNSWYIRMSVRLNISDDCSRLRSYNDDTLLLLMGPPLALIADIFPAPFYSKNWLISSRFYLFCSNKLVLGVALIGGRDRFESGTKAAWPPFLEVAGLGGSLVTCSAAASC